MTSYLPFPAMTLLLAPPMPNGDSRAPNSMEPIIPQFFSALQAERNDKNQVDAFSVESFESTSNVGNFFFILRPFRREFGTDTDRTLRRQAANLAPIVSRRAPRTSTWTHIDIPPLQPKKLAPIPSIYLDGTS
jgi:hypothetical protein